MFPSMRPNKLLIVKALNKSRSEYRDLSLIRFIPFKKTWIYFSVYLRVLRVCGS